MNEAGLVFLAFACCLVLVFWLTGREMRQWLNKEDGND